MNIKLFNFCYVLLLITCSAAAQTDHLPETFEIKTDTAKYITLPAKNFQLLLESKPLTIAQVRSAEYSPKFKDNDSILKEHRNYWLRYKIKNSVGTPLDLTIPEVMEGHVYIIGPNGKQTVFKSGFNIPWSQKDGLKKIDNIVFSIPANTEVTVYEHVLDYPAQHVECIVGIAKNIIKTSYTDNDSEHELLIWSAISVGFLFFAALINLFFYLVIRERVYLVYSIMLFFTTVSVSTTTLYSLMFKEYPMLFYFVYYFALVMAACLCVITILMFLQVKQIYPKIYKIIFWLNIATLTVLTVYFINNLLKFMAGLNKYLDILTIILPPLLVISLLTISIVELFKKKRVARLLISAISPFLLIFIMPYVFFTYRPGWLDSGIKLSIIWAVIVISWSLFDRFKNVLNDNMQQSLDKERILREKEEERNNYIAQQNELLEQQVAERTAELQRSLANLQQTQNQLIQSEKMASLGELTAGIAHEIQNPLNFVNNFSDVNIELLDEMNDELDKNDIEEAREIANDIKQNLEKIAHHGRRADGIVKGMLQHSRASSGQKEATDINLVADEYLRLAYHGLRAKDKSFNATLVTNFGESLPKVNIVPQDVGRVLLNLFTNAFYATQEKSKQWAANSDQSQLSGLVYKPQVEVITKQKDKSIQIIVKDNGIGIPDAIKDKILQPFFTTKPTGEGTGLGLSLSYDIVVKGHNGTIDIQSIEGEGAEFSIIIPL